VSTARNVLLVAWTVRIEAVRRREIYAIVLVAVGLIALVLSLDFFGLEGLHKFYREVSLKVMTWAAALTVLVLAARQLPREFDQRTIYPLLARPMGRAAFLAGKLAGVMTAGAFCFGLLMLVFVAGTLVLGGDIPWALFGQFIYLQLVMFLILACLGFLLSMLLSLDAAITIGVVFFALAATMTHMISMLHPEAGPGGRAVFKALTVLLPQLTLFDLSEKAVHSEAWAPLSGSVLAQLTVYGVAFASVYFTWAWFLFRRRPV